MKMLWNATLDSFTSKTFILSLCDISVMSSRLTAIENKVTAITVELERAKTEQQFQKKKSGGG